MINVSQLRQDIIRPVLQEIGLWSRSAEDLVLGTAAQESHAGEYLKQLGSGPARGIYQIEEPSYNDTLMRSKPALVQIASQYKIGTMAGFDQIEGNLYWATAVCRMKYFLAPGDLPQAGDIDGYAAYWKKWWNTPQGAGTVDEFMTNYKNIVGENAT